MTGSSSSGLEILRGLPLPRLFARIFPLIPPFDLKEGMRFRHVIKVGKKNISAVVRE